MPPQVPPADGIAMSPNDDEIQALKSFIHERSSKSRIVDFDELISLSTIRSTLRIWKESGTILGFACVDDFNNLWFDTVPEYTHLEELNDEIIKWGVACIRDRGLIAGDRSTLDSSCSAEDADRINVLSNHGFLRQEVRTLRYSRSLAEKIVHYPLPAGFSIRHVRGRDEVDDLVALHRAAFGTENMSIEWRLAMMNGPHYMRELDLVAVAPDGELAAFCVCGLEDPACGIGYTDPIGTHPHYRRIGLAKAIVSAGLLALETAGANTVELGTSSENIAMQCLAPELGFVCVSEKLWFSKAIS